MAKGTEVETTFVGYDPATFDNVQWETAHVEAADQVSFDSIGDMLIGIYAGHELIYPDPDTEPTKFFVQLKWTIPGGAVFTNAGYDLRTAYTSTVYDSEGKPTVTDKIAIGTMTRNVLMKLVDVDQASEMKSFRVDTTTLNGNADNKA